MTYQSVVEIVDGIDRLSNRKGKKSALFVTDFLTEPGTVLMNSIKESVNFIYGYCEIADVKTVRSLLDETSNNLDFIFLHSNIYNNIDEHPENTLIFDDRKCWSDSVASLLQILHSRNHVESALLAGDSWLLQGTT